MEKRVWKSGESLPPEVINELMKLSFDKKEDEVGYLPLPGDYSQKVETFKTSNGSVDLSKAKSSVVIIEHEGSPTSLQPVTINVNNVSTAKVIFFVPRGTDYPVTLSLPVNTHFRKDVSIQGGNSALLTWFSYGGNHAWRWYEIQKEPIYTPSAHDFTVHKEDPVTLAGGAGYIEVVPSDNIKVKSGIVDFTIQFVIDRNNQAFGGNFALQLYDDTIKEPVIEKTLYKANIWEDSEKNVLMTFRFAFSAESAKKYSIRARFDTQEGSSVSMGTINVTGTWIEQ